MLALPVAARLCGGWMRPLREPRMLVAVGSARPIHPPPGATTKTQARIALLCVPGRLEEDAVEVEDDGMGRRE